MSVNTVSTSNQLNTPETPDGYQIGSAVTSKVGFYGSTPVIQATNASQAAVTAITDTSGGTAHLDTGLQALTSTYNSGIIANAISSLALASQNSATLLNSIRTALVNVGIIKGS